MAVDITGSNLPTFAGGQPPVKKQRGPNRLYRGTTIQTRGDGKPDTGYGQNGSPLASSVQPAGRGAANLSDLDTAPPAGDKVLDALIDGGKPNVSAQMRTVDASPIKTTFGMKAANAAGKVLSKLG